MTTWTEKVNLQVLEDDPTAISTRIVGATLAHVHFSGPEGLKASLGADVLWALPFVPGLEAQGNAYWTYVGINSAGGFDYESEGGAAYPLYSTTKSKELKILLKFKETMDVHTKTTEMKYIPSTADYLVQGKARGGLLSKRSGYRTSESTASETNSAFNTLGLYAGLEITSPRNHPEYGRLDFVNMFPTMFAKAEAGMRVGEGWFFSMGAGLMVLRL